MFARVDTLCLSLVFALCASAASVSVRHEGQPTSSPGLSCDSNTGTQQCCNSLNKITDPILAPLLGLLDGLDIPVDALVGLTCNPILGANQCNAQAVCCTGDNIEGLVAIGCSPINIGL